MGTMMVQSIEGAFDEAIETAARKIHAASGCRMITGEGNPSTVKENVTSNDDGNDKCKNDIESSILFLEEKKQILKKTRTAKKKEEAYIAFNAHLILSGRERYSSRSSIWSEAKEIIDEYKKEGESPDEEDIGNASDLKSLLDDKQKVPSSIPSTSKYSPP